MCLAKKLLYRHEGGRFNLLQLRSSLKHVIIVAAYETCLKIRAQNRKGLIIPMGFMQNSVIKKTERN